MCPVLRDAVGPGRGRQGGAGIGGVLGGPRDQRSKAVVEVREGLLGGRAPGSRGAFPGGSALEEHLGLDSETDGSRQAGSPTGPQRQRPRRKPGGRTGRRSGLRGLHRGEVGVRGGQDKVQAGP